MKENTGEFRSLEEVLEQMSRDEDAEWDRLQGVARMMTETSTNEEFVQPDVS